MLLRRSTEISVSVALVLKAFSFWKRFLFFDRFVVLNASLSHVGNSGQFRSSYLGKAEQPQEQRYPFLSVCAVFLCPYNGMAVSV